jgi:peptide/nickel transport system permease protein
MSSDPIRKSEGSPRPAKPARPAKMKPAVPDEETLQHLMDASAKTLGIYMGVFLILAGLFAFRSKFVAIDSSLLNLLGYHLYEESMRWVLPLVIGLLASLGTMLALFRSRARSRFRTPFYLSVAGVAVSLVVLIVQQLDALDVLSMGSRSWLYPTSVLGISLAVLSLALGGTGSRRDKSISAITAFIPPVLLSFPLFVTLSSFSMSDYLLTAYLFSGVAIIISGIRLETLFEPLDEAAVLLKMDALAKRLGRYLGIVGLLLAGLIAYWFKSIDADLTWRALWGYYIDERSLVVEMSWVLPLVMGLLASLVIVWTLFKSRTVGRFRVPFYLSIAGLAVSLVVLVVQQLDAFQVLSLDSHSWLYPISVLGIGLAMVSLALGGTGSRRDKSISAIAAFIPPVLLSFPLFVTLSSPATADYLLVAYFWAGVAIIVSGMNLDTLYKSLELGKLAKWCGMSIGVLLLVAAIVTRSPRFYFFELRWIAPIAGGVVVSALAAWRIYVTDAARLSRPQGKSGSQTDIEGGSSSPIARLLRPLRRFAGWLLEGTYASYLSISGYLVSLTVFVVVYLDALELLNLGTANWLYPASIVGTSMAMISLSLAGEGDKRDRILSILTSLIPIAVLSVPMLLRLDAHQNPGLLSQILVVSAVAFGLSGINLHKAYVEAYVLREKLKLTALRTFKVFKQVLENPMGLVGVAILLFFVIMAAFGPALAPYDVPPVVGQFEKYLKPWENATAAPTYVPPIKYAIPLVGGMLSSIVVLGVVARSKAEGRRVMSYYVALLALVFSSVLLLLVLLDAWGLIGLGYPDWISPVSLLGVTFVFLSVGIVRADRSLKSLVGIVTAVAATAVLIIPALLDLNVKDSASVLFATYILSSILVITSGTALFSFYRGLKIVWTAEGSEEDKLIFNMGRLAKTLGALVGAAIFLAGIVAYLEGNWTLHWMGTDTFGYDVLSELIVGARTSIIVGIFSAVIASVLGAAVGLYSGYVGGWTDEVIMRANDVVLSIPWLVLMIIVAAMLGKIDLTGIILIIGLTGWSATARMVRAQVLSIRERQFIERARAIGSSDMAIVRRHVLPNAFPLVFANTILTVAVSILSEATLSFLGMRPVGVVTWGTMLSYASSANAFHIGLQWWIVAPGLCIVTIVLGFTLLGYALDDILNPKLRKR